MGLSGAVWAFVQPPAGDPLIEGFRLVEAVQSDAMEQLYSHALHGV